jgi:hypothetical protein
MPGFTFEPLPTLGAIRIVVDISDDPDVGDVVDCQLYRSTRGPDHPESYEAWTKVRVRPTYWIDEDGGGQYGSPWEMFNTVDVWYDAEAPLDTPVYYLIELPYSQYPYMWGAELVHLVDGDDADFEASVGAWSADADAAVSHLTVAPLFGVGSMRVTLTASVPYTGARLPVIPVTAGLMYGISGWLRSPAGGYVRLGVDWLDAGMDWLSVSYATQDYLEPGITVRQAGNLVAPASAAFAQFRVVYSSGTVGQFVDLDRMRMWSMGNPDYDGTYATPTILPSNGAGWLTDPTVPGEPVRLSLLPTDACDVDELLDGTSSGVIFAAHSAEQRAATGQRFDVVAQANPVPVTGIRKSPTGTLTLATVSFADRDQVHDLLNTGRVTMLRLPAEYGIPDRYLDVADVNTTALSPDLRLPYRVLDLPYASVDQPAGATAGVLGTRIRDLDRFATWADFDQARLTTLDLLHGAGSTTGVTP